MDKKRLVIQTDDPGEGGVAIYMHALACGLARRGLAVTCIQTENNKPMVEAQRRLGVKHFWLPFNTRTEFWRTATNPADAEQAFAATEPDCVLFANCGVWSHILAKSAAIQRGIPFMIVENYTSDGENLPPELTALLPYLELHYDHAKAVVAVSHDNLGLLRRYFGLPEAKGEVIHYGRPDGFFVPRSPDARGRIRRQYGIPADAILCLTVGRLEEIKGYQLILKAIRILLAKLVDSRLYFAWLGAGPLEASLRQSLKEIGADNRVLLPGHQWNVLAWLDASDIFLLPSYWEGMPLSIMEAMAKGLPVLATAVSGIPEELGDTGQLLPSPHSDAEATVAAIASTLELWAGDARLRESLGAACHTRASALFREDRMIDQTLEVIERDLLPK